MNLTHRRLLGVVLIVIALLAASVSGASASRTTGHGHGHTHGGSVKLVVNTQFGEETSPVVKATGRFRSCTSVTDLYGDAVDLGFTQAFFGLKQVNCEDGVVLISYGALLGVSDPETTRGHWQVLVSTLPGVRSGGGPLYGDSSKCVVLPGNEGCILDVFLGRLR